MFQATMSQVIIFRKIIESLNALVQEVNIEATNTGLSLQAMDSAHVSLVSLKIQDTGFEEYRCDKNTTLGINLADFSKILKMAKPDDTLTLKAEEDNSYLSILFDNKKTEKIAEFQLNLLNLELQSLGIPETEYPTSIKMSSAEFVSLCRDFTTLSDSIKIEVKGEQVTFSIVGKSGNGKLTLKNNTAEKIEDQIIITNNEDVCCSYGLQYLNSFAKASSLSNVVTLNISAKFPLMIEYEIEEVGFIKFYLAPKMDEETIVE